MSKRKTANLTFYTVAGIAALVVFGVTNYLGQICYAMKPLSF